MIFPYLFVGFVVCASYNVMPTDGITDLQADPTRRPSRGELAAAIALWCVAVAVWPLMIVLRALAAIRDRLDGHGPGPRDEHTGT